MSFMTQTVLIERPVEEVFQAAVDFSNSPQIMEAVVAVELLSDGPVREGYKFKETREIRGRKVSAVIEVTALEENRSYSVKSVQSGLDLRYHYQFEPAPGGTKVVFKGELFTQGLRNTLTRPLIKQIIKKEDQDHLQHLKKFIES
ncbi:SRPBCC family protein [Halobacillus kuroshimensis]|uniref:SRPBCC family protein n=1 Tax=Halobacillus kuroshimensis TaxID=302481 RepID=A0ABS3DY21_9BACI|nr:MULTISPECIES: SRPBCC family protein [Halobacillus]MBN8236219.1 SRPBCC family protein [Halobacillus kuroshimensis]